MLRIALYSVLYLMSYQILRKKSTVYFFPKSFVLLKTKNLWPVGVAGIGKSFRRSVATDGSFKWNYPAEGVATNVVGAQGETSPSKIWVEARNCSCNFWVVRDARPERRGDFPLKKMS